MALVLKHGLNYRRKVMSIKINLDKAKEIWKDELRKARKPILEKLDTDYIRALESGDDTTEISKRKQELRDITKHPDLVETKNVDQIKAFWPEILNN